MSAPTKLPVWADAPTDPVPGTAVAPITEPADAIKHQGWTIERPPLGVFNWWMNLVYQWIQYLSATLIPQVAVPIGTPMTWFGHLVGIPALPDGWVECNGQTLSDALSPINGIVIPNLNGAAAGADTFSNGKVAVFLRGGVTAGVYQGSQNKSFTLTTADGSIPAVFETIECPAPPDGHPEWDTILATGTNVHFRPQSLTATLAAGTPDESRPCNCSAIYIMRVH